MGASSTRAGQTANETQAQVSGPAGGNRCASDLVVGELTLTSVGYLGCLVNKSFAMSIHQICGFYAVSFSSMTRRTQGNFVVPVGSESFTSAVAPAPFQVLPKYDKIQLITYFAAQ
ncbi:hypothetical protein R3P38DRAFT_2772144 [Favolaschia claudopus]|uniref:Uncharacterized protein n=1 Tax=Favolaschia claudopus TaxID=2862362 RepID=A0AAW0C7B6_9AGAR